MNGTATETLDPFITPDELGHALGGEELDSEQAQWLCEWGSEAVRAEVAQTINVIEGDEVMLDGLGSPLILLPELEVREVRGVCLGEEELRPGVDYEWNAAGCLWRRRSYWYDRVEIPWPKRPRALRVTYDHGWAPRSPQWNAARQVALEVAARTFRNPGMLQSERLGDWSRAWVPRGGRAELTPAEQRSLDILRTGR